MIQIGGEYTTLCQEEGILLQKYRDRNGVSRYFSKVLGSGVDLTLLNVFTAQGGHTPILGRPNMLRPGECDTPSGASPSLLNRAFGTLSLPYLHLRLDCPGSGASESPSGLLHIFSLGFLDVLDQS